jgi:hypothetical protein
MRVIRLLAVVATALGVVGLTAPAVGAGSAETQPIWLQVGETTQITGAPVGCKAVLRAGVKTFDCRIAGSLTGSYGVLVNGKRVLVVRFENTHLGKIVFAAQQHGGFRVCH